MKKLNNTTYRRTARDDPCDRIEVEIGDAKQSEFFPQSKIKRWDNECNFSVRLQDRDKREIQRFSKNKDKVEWGQGNFKAEFYDVDNAHKFIWYLKSKPATNKIRFSIQSKSVDFYYQPPFSLTEEEKKQGYSIDKNYDRNGEIGHTVLDENDNLVRFRPLDVVGSYAVYHSTKGGVQEKGGMKYRTGKVAHIYRPKIIDSEGKETWGELNINNGTYEVTIPQEFLDRAVYPIKSNDTFGYEEEGQSADDLSTEWGFANRPHTCPGSGTLDSITLHIEITNRWIDNQLSYGLYKTSDDSKVDITEEVNYTTASTSWKTLQAISGNDVDNIDYHLVAHLQDQSEGFISYDTQGGYVLGVVNTFTTWPNSFSSWYDRNYDPDFKYSIYATYTPSGGGAESGTGAVASISLPNLSGTVSTKTTSSSVLGNIVLSDLLGQSHTQIKSFGEVSGINILPLAGTGPSVGTIASGAVVDLILQSLGTVGSTTVTSTGAKGNIIISPLMVAIDTKAGALTSAEMEGIQIIPLNGLGPGATQRRFSQDGKNFVVTIGSENYLIIVDSKK